MPTYDYRCEACGQTFEISHGFFDDSPEVCSCGSEGTLRRLISAGSGLIFKGTGFYATDYKRNGVPKGPAKPCEAASSTEGKAPISCSTCPANPANTPSDTQTQKRTE